MATLRKKRPPRQLDRPLRFNEKLVLNQWILNLFEVESLAKLSEDLKSHELEGYDESNVSLFYHQLTQRLFERWKLSNDVLLAYDANIFRHTHRLNERRREPISWKYFQYLSLLFTEIYLDRFFSNPGQLEAELNAWVSAFNRDKPTSDQVSQYESNDLRKIALWSATGSGKTLVMHVNILQCRFYLEKHRRLSDMNRIILLTPNEGLSLQHLKEFRESGLAAELFDPGSGSLFAGQTIEIIDIHKLGEEKGEKRVAVESFEGNNLVLVDEGHRGASGETWKDRRNKLCEEGFSFEYSATFSQAVNAATGDQKKKLTNEYAKAIFFDYSYPRFYHDGYGKDYRILNMAEDRSGESRPTYLTACLLAFYQQLCILETKHRELAEYLLEKPLWIFVGGSVTETISARELPDVIEILRFFDDFLRNANEYTKRIDLLLRGKHELLDRHNHRLFQNTFTFLIERKVSAEDVYEDVLKRLFNSSASGALHLEELKGTKGEVAMRVGGYEPFGVINVGDAAKLCKKCEEKGFNVSQREFNESLFEQINEPDSTIQVLVGSKKFSEGWSSWRVSTMGLMHVGKGEGSQIIQLFGRGVRLKGYKFGLKRSSRLDELIKRPKHVREVETLNVFGIHADYMEEFKRFLEEDGLPTGDERDEVMLPVLQTLPKSKLKIVKLPENLDFKRNGPKPSLEISRDGLTKRIVLDWYPKIQARLAPGTSGSGDIANRHQTTLSKVHLAFLNWDEVYFEILNFKNERAWFNLNISHDRLKELMFNPTWYTLIIPPDQLEMTSFEKVRLWQEVTVSLLKKYANYFYKQKKAGWEGPQLIYANLDPTSENFFPEYTFMIEQSEQDIRTQLNEIKEAIDSSQLKDFSFGGLETLAFSQHLYQPLIYLKNSSIKVYPVHLNDGERDFVSDLRTFYRQNSLWFAGKELYLLRNRSKGGIGFFEAGNFYPDFIMWILDSEKQYVSFVDPKGLRNLDAGIDNPKIQFYRKIKELQKPQLDPNIVLNAFIVTPTKFSDPGWWSGHLTKRDFEDRNVFFQEDKNSYILKMLTAVK